jgi:translation initiation factor 2B subunit (eIF-2B alpha/beta/delta family)
LEIQDIQNQLDELRNDNTSGASEFINKALVIIKQLLDRIKDPNKIIEQDFILTLKLIIDTRPSMAPLINTMAYLISNLNQINKFTIETRLKQFYIEKERRFKSLELNFQRFLEGKKSKLWKIMILSYSSTIINLLLKSKKFNFEIYVMESRPLLEGHRVAELLSSHFQTHLIIDAAIGTFIDEIDVVLIGVDSILKDGSIINKIGTFPLALLAKSKEKDIFAVCDTYKYNLKSHYGYDISITEKPISEVYNKQITNKFLEVHNYYFDITPAEYISGIISELGILKIPEFLEQVTNVLPIEWFKYFMNNKKI